ncbi:MAG: hypothetical protein COV47_05430 [Candidatus Diapherotrites archaeon CG11_big_fil_rev_8_21_14_0_20_37_9]|nr:MAG: hypothetical protein COV47_05430 [Candidatus Diapherotrites archaeon CG11_big_fil_rev_8_21_14_0_20_37_9]
MGYSHTNSKGKKYYLNSIKAKNGQTLYFFSKEPKKPCEMPEGRTVVENPLTFLPILKKK